jgi:hypothetical protein
LLFWFLQSYQQPYYSFTDNLGLHRHEKIKQEGRNRYSLTNHVSFLPLFGAAEAQGSIVTLSLTGTYIFSISWEVDTSRLQIFNQHKLAVL